MGHEPKFFAKLDGRRIRQADYIALVTIIRSFAGLHSEIDIILYRWLSGEKLAKKWEKYELVRFLPEDKNMARGFFPHGPPHLRSGPAWRETTDWLAPIVTLDVSHHNVDLRRVDNYPQRQLPPHFRR